jgi:hypothetical protein
MPVNKPCNLYLENWLQWNVVRDCIKGEIAIKAKGENYLPRLPGQIDIDYAAYKERPKFFDGTSRTAEGLHGQIFSQAPYQNGEISEAFKELLKNVDANGMILDQFSSNILWDAMQTGWGGILVDYPLMSEGTSIAESNAQAYIKWYQAEAIIRWQNNIVNGVKKLALVVLREDIEEQKVNDEFETVITEAYRVLSFDEDGNYIQRLFVKNEDKEAPYISSEPIYAKINGENLREIPFFTCPGEVPEKSMLLGMAFENIGHYQKSADYENGLHITGVPTPIAENMKQPVDANNKPLTVKLGATEFQFFYGGPDNNVNVKFLEFSGGGLNQLRLALNDSLERMAKLGIKAIGEEKKVAETAKTASIHRSAENGLLGAFARNMSDKITQAIRLMAKWNNIDEAEADGWSYELNNNFDYEDVSNQILQVMHSARMSGELPRSVWFTFLKKHGILQEELQTYDDFLAELEKDNPLLSLGPREEDDIEDQQGKDGDGLKDNRS